MPNPRYPGAVWNPGTKAGYTAGRNTMQSVVCHYTVGRNSTNVGIQGYFHFLVSRDGRVQQFCEVDAVAWHAGDPWNSRGPGIEIEYLDEPAIFTPEAEAATGQLVSWLNSEWDVPLDFYDGPRVNAWRGFITHRALIQTGDPHSDYWPHLPVGGPVPLDLADLAGIKKVVGGDPNLDGSIPTISQVIADIAQLRALISGVGGASGLSADDVRQIVRDELDATRLAH